MTTKLTGKIGGVDVEPSARLINLREALTRRKIRLKEILDPVDRKPLEADTENMRWEIDEAEKAMN